ncbi:hypothetical protein QE152_g9432 [Popillia japonica]|uniref:Uncharacterized protein n=1 Tax=Popillia japonica TaxID=7064 RepID=A0AAW1LYM2_POPJA
MERYEKFKKVSQLVRLKINTENTVVMLQTTTGMNGFIQGLTGDKSETVNYFLQLRAGISMKICGQIGISEDTKRYFLIEGCNERDQRASQDDNAKKQL